MKQAVLTGEYVGRFVNGMARINRSFNCRVEADWLWLTAARLEAVKRQRHDYYGG